MAAGTVKMYMLVGMGNARAVMAAYRKAGHPIGAYYFMHNARLFKIFQRAVERYPVHFVKCGFQLGMRHSQVGIL